ncbi:MAG TPA: hypothetical protein VFO76_02735 [Candidatus Kapabacteria bacterium]|nr:hypothetical protein [Candidatus Kapabacteria bacterium]
MKKILLLLVIAVSFGASNSFAQADGEKALVDRANRLLDSSMASVNVRAQRFNEEMSRVNQLKPFDSTSLTVEKIKSNRASLKEFLSYLEVYRSLSAKLLAQVDDSIMALRADAPRSHRETYLQEFQEAVHKDQETFNKFTLALTSLWKKIDEVLEFLQNSKTELHGGKIQFTVEDEYKKYQALMEEVNKLNKKASTAGSASSKAAFEASQVMNEAYGTGPKK